MKHLVLAILTSVALLPVGALPAQAVGTGDQGCTPGYWKNHTGNWEEFRPTRTLTNAQPTSFTFPDSLASFRDDTYLQALNYKGGSGLAGATRILMRAAVAALLNAVHDGLAYPLTRSQIVAQVNDALASEDRATILALANELDRLNNSGCPL